MTNMNPLAVVTTLSIYHIQLDIMVYIDAENLPSGSLSIPQLSLTNGNYWREFADRKRSQGNNIVSATRAIIETHVAAKRF